jgi:adenylate cyclase
MELGTVGSGDHFEYRPLGDIINTATRIEGLSKHLGTWVLASGDVIVGLDGLATREIGCFRPVGKSRSLTIHELLPGNAEPIPTPLYNGVTFNEALRQFRAGDWRAAHAAFADYLSAHKQDGPAKFYLRLCARYERRPPPDWDGTITLREK